MTIILKGGGSIEAIAIYGYGNTLQVVTEVTDDGNESEYIPVEKVFSII